MAARQKVEFLRREGIRLNPYQQALIHQLPYDAAGSGRLARDMGFILKQGETDPGHEAGYRRRRLSALLKEQQERDKAAEAASGEK